MILVFDSYAWIEYFLGSEKGRQVKNLLEQATAVYTPSIVLVEIANKYFREGMPRRIVKERLEVIQNLSIVEYVEKEYLLRINEAREILMRNKDRLGIKRKPSAVDFYVLAVALELKAKIVTGDKHFRGLNMVLFLGDKEK